MSGATAQPGDGSIDSKRAEAEQVLAQINAMDARLTARVEAYNEATYQLEKTQHELAANAVRLANARASLKQAHATLAQRAVALYTSGETESTLAVMIGASSLDDLINRLDTADRVSAQDAAVVREVTNHHKAVTTHKTTLLKARAKQQRMVSTRAAEKATVERQLAAREAYFARVKGQIADLLAEQAAAQRAAQARAVRAAQARLNPEAGSADSPAASVVHDATATATAPSGHGDQIASLALAELGKPYRWAAAGPDAFDCSGLVVWVYGKIGMSVPHSTYSLINMGAPVDRSQLQPGDLVFFSGLGHMGIYIGGGNFVHAPSTGDVVKVTSMASRDSNYYGARRL